LALHLTGIAAADAILADNPFALLSGMLLDQQVPMEKAFSGPFVLAERLGGRLDPHEVASYDPERFAKLMAGPPAVHRFPGSMGGRIQSLAKAIVEEYAGDTAAVWRDAKSGQDLLARLVALPGFGEQKARIFVALLGKQLGVRPAGWREAAGEYGEQGVYRSVADITDEATLAKVRAYKQEKMRAARA
jgi:uncharacterized HhH-GPD family protein